MVRYNWHQIVKLGKLKVLELAKQLGVFNKAYAVFEKKQRGAYFIACSIVYHAQQQIFKYYGSLTHNCYFQFNRVSSKLTFHERLWKECCAIAINSAKGWKRYYYVSRGDNGFLKITDREPKGNCARVDAAARVFIRS